jgi:alginate O-acetyltransferase complex protein AlgI
VNNSFLNLLITVPLPIGISFYTFEGISLLVDLYKGKMVLHYKTNSFYEHLTKTAFFISFFPHLIAGPILKAREFYPQIEHKSFKTIQWEDAVKKIILGFFLKMVIADNLKDITVNITFPYFQGLSSGNLLLLLFGYSMQIFADFAGYSLIAIGLGYLFGYSLPKNFNFPYISSSFSEFWRRWHISLSTWLRDYLYIPLGGNKKGEFRTYINLFLVMLLGGFWHGAAWSYAVWGASHGFFLMLERLILKDKLKEGKRSYLGMIIVFTVVTLLWLLFKLTEFSHVVAYCVSVFENIRIPLKFGINELAILFYSSLIMGYHFFYLWSDSPAFVKRFVQAEPVLYGLLLFLILTNSGSQGSFIYFQF